MREAIATARSIDEAIEKACEEIGLPRESVEIEVLETGKKGLFGSKPCKVRVFVEEPETEKKVEKKIEKKEPVKAPVKKEKAPEVKEEKPVKEEPDEEATPDEKTLDKINAAMNYVNSIVRELGLDDLTVSYKYYRSGLKISIDGESVGVIIGKRGETLDALQTLTSLAVNKKDDNFLRISINSGDYREKRKKTLEELAIKVAKTVAETGRKHTFEPMSAYERRIIHSAAATVEGVTSKSFGEEPERKVVILSNNPRPQRGGKKGGKGYRNDRADRREREPNPVGGTNHSDDSAYFSLLDEFE